MPEEEIEVFTNKQEEMNLAEYPPVKDKRRRKGKKEPDTCLS